MKRHITKLLVTLTLLVATVATAADTAPPPSYFDHASHGEMLTGGVKMIPITTPKGTFHVWTKRVGNDPKLAVLLLHGGPGETHEYLEVFDSFLPAAGIEYIYYDQLGSAYSDQPKDDSLWTVDRYVDEVEQVRQALHLDKNNFCVLGHSWGGVLAMEYALKYQQHLKCLVISNMVDSIPAYNAYANTVLMPAMDQAKLAEVKKLEAEHRTSDPRYMAILGPMQYEQHVLRLPQAQWPEPVTRSFGHMNEHIYNLMQGPSELGASGRLLNWDRSKDLQRITVPTLVIGAQHDTMDPKYMQGMAKKLPHGQFLLCPKGSHMAMYDDQQTYFDGLIGFLKKVEAE
ncbi:proline iminopeptidase-family hydrolase [Rhodanobacter sp. AS-Z3]|uniref:proline iminopeptidase-family hydrolase n=1 Tax=Rhodanobacter sp. AS-Z3 TaxID=3031330 RepID=UPI00247A3D37|nr:proline iminopeptidase-family hydrolase [Rhodanobacter sp. AS-Z3]WEN14448.1 proline iminopeptidase-family hydrolase [Rhodanobacter sp. AS-Z3]